MAKNLRRKCRICVIRDVPFHVRHRKKLENKGLRYTWRNQRVGGSTPIELLERLGQTRLVNAFLRFLSSRWDSSPRPNSGKGGNRN
jgi:hypothetical protein